MQRDQAPKDKKHKPPRFVHLPAQQAIKAKQAWVHKVKLRSKWAKQKRNFASGPNAIVATKGSKDDVSGDQSPGKESIPEQEMPRKRHREDELPNNANKRLRQDVDARDSKKHAQNPESEKPRLSQEEEAALKARKERVRELARKAYAPESLHSFKADPLGRRRSQTKPAAGIHPTSRGRGQPNMKLRMNALLEKIKLDAGTV